MILLYYSCGTYLTFYLLCVRIGRRERYTFKHPKQYSNYFTTYCITKFSDL